MQRRPPNFSFGLRTLGGSYAKWIAQRHAFPLTLANGYSAASKLPGSCEAATGCPSRRHQSIPPSSFGTKSEPSKLVRALGRCIATDPVAIDDIDLAAVEPCSSL